MLNPGFYHSNDITVVLGYRYAIDVLWMTGRTLVATQFNTRIIDPSWITSRRQLLSSFSVQRYGQ